MYIYLCKQWRQLKLSLDLEFEEFVVNLNVPKVILEGEQFFPLLTVSKLVDATFHVYIPFGAGTAQNQLDFSFDSSAGDVSFRSKNTTSTTPSSVNILTDHLVEPNETFNVVVQLSTSPCDIANLLKFTNQTEMITIIDNNSEWMCMSLRRLNILMAYICFHVMQTLEYELCSRDLFNRRYRQVTT